MSPASKSITPAPSMPGMDWARLKTPELDSDIEDNDETAMAKAKERHWHKVEKKRCEDEETRLREEEEKRCRKEEEKRLWEEQEAELRRQEEEQRQREEMQRKATEANKKRQRDEVEAGSSVARGPGMCCVHCAKAGVSCEFMNNGNKRRTACDRCAAQREKCEWPEMHAPGAGKGKAKAKEVPTSPHQGEKKKRVRKAKVQDDDEVEIIGERDELPDGGVGAGAKGVNTGTLGLDTGTLGVDAASRKARRALEVFVDEAAICGVPEESEEESSEEEVDEGELQEELAGLDEEQAENPMSPPRKQVT
ncbi:hypothetical protein BU15DRAFT_72914 [Melanogaster broomeanus]|nr:hypothetical protein BU15DRAFT_72914 [Melanogaster broomeanus]